MSWIQTFTGKRFYPLDPIIADIDIRDIAHALSMICRFNGHCKRFYSVAEHSLYVANKCPQHLKLLGLLHDAPEAYLCDLVRPIKHEIAWYKTIENNLMQMIAEKYGLEKWQNEVVHGVDNRVLQSEFETVMYNSDGNWGLTPRAISYEDIKVSLRQNPMSPEQAEKNFLAFFHGVAQ